MDLLPSQLPAWRRPGTWMVVVALGLYAWLLAGHIGACAGGADSSGYFNHARLLASGHVHAVPRALPGLPPEAMPPYTYVPLGFEPTPDNRSMVPTYSTGLPLLIITAVPFAGWEHAGDLVLCLHALLGVGLVYALGRVAGLSVTWSVTGAVMLAASPLYLFMSLQAMSDVPALVWTTLTLLAAWRSRQHGAWALAAGAALAVDVLIRPSNALAFIPVAVALGLAPRRWFGLGLGGLPGAIFFCLHSRAAYGHAFMTGYGDVSSLFSASLIPGTLLHYVRWLPALFTPLVILVFGLPWASRGSARFGTLLAVWLLAYLGFYSAYYCTHETWWYLRFILPAAPALIVASLLVARKISTAWPAFTTAFPALPIALLLVTTYEARWSRKLDVLKDGWNEKIYPETTTWLRTHLPADSVIAAMQVSGALRYDTGFTFVRWDEVQPDDFRRILGVTQAAHRPVYAALFPFEVNGALQQHLPGRWVQVGTVRQASIWRHESDPAKP